MSLPERPDLSGMTPAERYATLDVYCIELVARLRAAEQAREVLKQVLEWPLPQGTVETYSLPGWLARKARAAVGDNTPS